MHILATRLGKCHNNKDGWITTLFFSDESHIYLNGFMNKQNFRSTQKPTEVHAPKVTVWCGLNMFEKRINLCIEQLGGHFEHLL